jgi:hypothetical protein
MFKWEHYLLMAIIRWDSNLHKLGYGAQPKPDLGNKASSSITSSCCCLGVLGRWSTEGRNMAGEIAELMWGRLKIGYTLISMGYYYYYCIMFPIEMVIWMIYPIFRQTHIHMGISWDYYWNIIGTLAMNGH